jgi:TRAP-type transport system small permease protein
MAKLLGLYCQILKCIIAVCLAVMVVLVFGNVVLRYIFNSGITMSEELSRWLMVWLTFLGAIVALREHSHLGVDTLVRALPPAGKRICFVLSYDLMLYANWLLLAGSWQQTTSQPVTERQRPTYPSDCSMAPALCSASQPASF